ncbi:MAG: TauD/TfdA family dioxygenase [Proteobacteria bacterium]|nr:TauD/TfdA family dioxygenase [Pseudomonadota bacterium]
MSQHFEIHERVPGFVAEIAQIGALCELTDDVVRSLKATWAEYPVLVFPQAELDNRGLLKFARCVGEFGADPYLQPIADDEHIVEVRRGAQESTPIFGASWHSDWSFQVAPPSGTLLHAKIVPSHGGDTIFADCYRAYETLPMTLKVRIENLTASHSAAPSYGKQGLFAKDDHSRSMRIIVSEAAEASQSHPIVRTHPESGRRGLFINHVYTIRVDELDPGESQNLLGQLFKHMTQDDFLYRHQWQTNTLVLWDNRCVVHHAEGGYAGHERLMHRITLAGERPYLKRIEPALKGD